MADIKTNAVTIIMFFILLYNGYLWAGQLWPIAENSPEISHQILYKIAITITILLSIFLIPILTLKGRTIHYQNVFVGLIAMMIGIMLADVLMGVIWNLTNTLGGASENINIIGLGIIGIVALMVLVVPNAIMIREEPMFK